jgi:hypothetical protein
VEMVITGEDTVLMIKYTVEVNDEGTKFWYVYDKLHCERFTEVESLEFERSRESRL